MRNLTAPDRIVGLASRALASVAGHPVAGRTTPVAAGADELDAAQRRAAGALMRVNHVGEVCAQALYESQALATRDPELAARFRQAAAEEGDHLAWTRQRLDELGDRPSLLNPLW